MRPGKDTKVKDGKEFFESCKSCGNNLFSAWALSNEYEILNWHWYLRQLAGLWVKTDQSIKKFARLSLIRDLQRSTPASSSLKYSILNVYRTLSYFQWYEGAIVIQAGRIVFFRWESMFWRQLPIFQLRVPTTGRPTGNLPTILSYYS